MKNVEHGSDIEFTKDKPCLVLMALFFRLLEVSFSLLEEWVSDKILGPFLEGRSLLEDIIQVISRLCHCYNETLTVSYWDPETITMELDCNTPLNYIFQK